MAEGWKPCPKCLRIIESWIFFQKTYFHQNVSLGTENAFSTTMAESFWQKAANDALSVIKTFKIQLTFKTLIFIKLFLWTLVCIRDNTDEKLLARGRNYFFLCPQNIESNWNFFTEKTSFHSKCGSAHVEVHSDNLVKVLMPKCRKFIERLKCFGSKLKNDRKTDFYFFKKTTLNVWKRRMHFLKPRRRFSVKSLKKVHQCPHWQKLLFFQKENNFTNVFLSTRRGRFHNPTENVQAKSGNVLHQRHVLIILQFLYTKVLKISNLTPKI